MCCAFILPNQNLFSKWQCRQGQHRQCATLHASGDVKLIVRKRIPSRPSVRYTEHPNAVLGSASAVPFRPRIFPASMLFCLRRFLNFFWNGAGKARAGFSFEGETDGIHCCVIYTLVVTSLLSFAPDIPLG
jgi:hypothetical protein